MMYLVSTTSGYEDCIAWILVYPMTFDALGLPQLLPHVVIKKTLLRVNRISRNKMRKLEPQKIA